jgi:polysaccharide pyruvyl transferase WcaK-like protein
MDAKYADRLHVIMRQYDQSQVKGIIGLCDFFVGARMHACIAALSQGIPTIGLAYSKKFKGVFESANVGECVVDMRETDGQVIIDKVIDAFAQRQSLTLRLKEQVSEIKSQVFDTFRQLVEV